MERLKNLVEQDMTYIVAGNESGDESNPTNHDFEVHRSADDEIIGAFHFQQGAIGEGGPNGLLNEDLLAVLIDRVESFQRSKMRCRENENALQHLYEALWWLNQRHNKKK